METMLEKIDLKNLDKSNWLTYKFEEIAQKISKTVKPEEANVDVYVGLEHLDSEDIHIRRKGVPSDVKGGKLRCYPGDVIFGKRRAYQRKAAIVDFEGICSAHAFVFRANPKVIDPKLFPFFLHSDQFMYRMIDISVGGLSPTINWGDLKNQEFLLPPKVQQAQLAELLWAMDEVIERENKLMEAANVAEEVKLKDIFLSEGNSVTRDSKLGPINPNWKCVKLGELINEGSINSHLDGNHGSFYPKNEEFVEEGVPYISANCIEDDEISLIKAKYLTEERADTISKGIALDGDILLAHNATVGPVCMLSTKLNRVILSTTLTYYRVNPLRINSTFLFYYMKSRLFQAQLEKVMSQSTRNQVPITTQRKLYFIIPPIEIQNELIKKLVLISNMGKKVESKISSSKSLQKSLINQVF